MTKPSLRWDEYRNAIEGGEIIRRYFRIKMLQWHKNILAGVVGYTGEGKSLTAIKLASIIDESFDLKKNVVYTAGQFAYGTNSRI